MVNLTSKLPHIGTSIFTTMSQMAAKHKALNMAQGYPDFPVNPELISKVNDYMKKGYNQYPPSMGIGELRENIALMNKKMMHVDTDPHSEITIVSGATEGIFSTISALIHRDDEVIIFDPAYDCYRPTVLLQNAKPIHLQLKGAEFTIDWDEVEAVITQKTKAIIINTPHNPTGKVFSESDMLELEKIVVKHQLIAISDEVYHHLVFDQRKHKSVLQFPELAQRSVAIFSFGKTFHATGWKMGYVIAPEKISKEIRKVHQFVTFTTHTPSQYAVSDFLKNEENYQYLPHFFQSKRDRLLTGIQNSRLKAIPTQGTYFQLLSIEDLEENDDVDFSKYLTMERKMATIPVSVFYQNDPVKKYLRVCFAKEDETLDKAAKILNAI